MFSTAAVQQLSSFPKTIMTEGAFTPTTSTSDKQKLVDIQVDEVIINRSLLTDITSSPTNVSTEIVYWKRKDSDLKPPPTTDEKYRRRSWSIKYHKGIINRKNLLFIDRTSDYSIYGNANYVKDIKVSDKTLFKIKKSGSTFYKINKVGTSTITNNAVYYCEKFFTNIESFKTLQSNAISYQMIHNAKRKFVTDTIVFQIGTGKGPETWMKSIDFDRRDIGGVVLYQYTSTDLPVMV
jgi:hypothetical protein